MSLPIILTASAALENDNKTALGIEYAYDAPPETLTTLPVSVRFGEQAWQLHGSRFLGRYNLWHFKIEVHLARGELMDSMPNALAVIEAYQTLYTANLSISSTCDVSGFREPACEGPVRLRYGPEIPVTIGVIFYMWAKEILDDITVDL